MTIMMNIISIIFGVFENFNIYNYDGKLVSSPKY